MTHELDELKARYREDYDSYDPYGSCVFWLFDLCESLYWHHNHPVPQELQFSPGLSDPHDGEGGAREFCDNTSPEALVEFAMILNRLNNIHLATGRDY